MSRMRLEKKSFTRSFSLPVQECLSHSWKDFMRIMHRCWRESTDLANWASRTLQRLDVVRVPGMASLPRWEPVDLYALAFGRAKERPARNPEKPLLPVVQAQYGDESSWAGSRVCAATLLRKVCEKYKRERGKIVWRRERRSPEFLYPYPFPVHKQAWVSLWSERGQPVLHLSLGGERVALRLRSGDEFRPALRVFGQIIDGELSQQELSICRQATHGHNGHQVQERNPGGGGRMSYRIMIRFAYAREVLVSDREQRVATCRTGRDPFLTLAIGDLPPFVLHAPWVRQWIAEHQKFLQDFSDDLKYEKRWPAKKRRALNGYRERRCEKHARRMKSFLQQTAAQIVGHAVRRKVTHLDYDDESRDFVSPFPWYQLEECLKSKCENEGVVFRNVASGGVVDETVETARVEAND